MFRKYTLHKAQYGFIADCDKTQIRATTFLMLTLLSQSDDVQVYRTLFANRRFFGLEQVKHERGDSQLYS